MSGPRTLEAPEGGALGSTVAALDAVSVMEACRQELRSVDEREREGWREAHVLDALYDPGGFVRVAYAFRDAAAPEDRVWPGSTIVYARAPARDEPSSRCSRVRVGEFEVDLYRFPRDRRLRGLRTLAGRGRALDLWQSWLDREGRGEVLDPETSKRRLVKYVPEHKWIARLRARATRRGSERVRTRRIAVRVGRPAACARMKERHARLAAWTEEQGRPALVPRVVGHEEEAGLIGVEWIEGESLLDVLRREESAPILRRVASVLASFHGAPRAALPRRTPDRIDAELARDVDDLAGAHPDLRPRLERIAGALRADLPRIEAGDLATLHDDLHVHQMLLSGERLLLLDLERMAVGDPWIDAVGLATQLRMTAVRPELAVDPESSRRWAAELLAAWGEATGAAEDSLRVRCYAISTLTMMARGAMRHLRPGWHALAERCVEECERLLAGGELVEG